MSGGILALELTDTIIDNFRYDKEALATCTLVCKAWAVRSTYHLFLDISVNKRNFDKILSLPKPSNRITGRARVLTILLLNAEQIQRFSTPRLQSFSSVTVLAFFKVAFPSMDDFAELVCYFPQLQVLSLNMSFWVQDNSNTRVLTRGCPPVGLHTLNVGLHISTLRMVGFPWLFGWFLEKGMPPLSVVRLHSCLDEEITSIGKALQQLRNSLQVLELEFDMGENDEDPPPDVSGIDLGHHHHLQSLSILDGHPTTLYELLRTMTPPCVLEYTKLLLNSEDILSARNCSKVDKLFSSSDYRSIQLDIVFMTQELDTQSQIEKIKSYFPLCSARGKLRIAAESDLLMPGQFEGFLFPNWRDPTLAADGGVIV